ncbi:carboxymuconolactone decarboxylase family protein [Stappia sp.]|jgi:AhpD family alkylhydroperoxidase|uniref:carboxymuconolactone decarboxylase family protein n=1 Tax=Stappia sp. TaxID=1870903 RepID=UPI003A99AE30
MSVWPLLEDDEMPARSAAVIDDIRATRKTDFINNFWRVLANDPALLERTWASLKDVMGPGVLDPKVKEMLYVAVSIANSCEYCIRSHTAAARAKGMSEAELGELMAIVGMASETNRLAIGLQVPVDAAFGVPFAGAREPDAG